MCGGELYNTTFYIELFSFRALVLGLSVPHTHGAPVLCHACPVHLFGHFKHHCLPFLVLYHLQIVCRPLHLLSNNLKNALLGTYCASFTNAYSTRDPHAILYTFSRVFYPVQFLTVSIPSTSDYCPSSWSERFHLRTWTLTTLSMTGR